jgi:hypothetical protein
VKILYAAKKPATVMPVLEVVLDGFVGRFIYRRNWAGTTIPLPGFDPRITERCTSRK